MTPQPQPRCCPALGTSGMGAPRGAGAGAGLPEGLAASEACLSQVLLNPSNMTLEKAMAPHSSILGLGNRMDRGIRWAIVHEIASL